MVHEAGNMPPLNKRVLVVKDEHLGAEDSACSLMSFGARARPVGTLDDALEEVVSGQALDAAVLDLRLHDELAFGLADGLHAVGIPSVFATGHRHSLVPKRHRGIPQLKKRCDSGKLSAAVARLLD